MKLEQVPPDDPSSAAAANQRAAAEELFVAHLAQSELSDESGFEALCTARPEMADELRTLRRAHQRALAVLYLGLMPRRGSGEE